MARGTMVFCDRCGANTDILQAQSRGGWAFAADVVTQGMSNSLCGDKDVSKCWDFCPECRAEVLEGINRLLNPAASGEAMER